MSSTSLLVEHFFRHEYGRLVAVLTRQLGTRRLDLIEDVVQSALSRALANWPRAGAPQNPSAWLNRVARNLAVDALRRERSLDRIVAAGVLDGRGNFEQIEEPESIDDREVGDESLRLLFLCCHPSIPAESQIALALKTVSGFGTREIAQGLMTTVANVEKRLTRAKERLRSESQMLDELSTDQVRERLEPVLSTVYLIFNEGFSATCGETAIRRDLCEEAIRLARMLVANPTCNQPVTCAALALFLMHAARLDSRVNGDGGLVLLADQDRANWQWNQIREAMDWMARSARGDALTRFHIEAAIAWEHCRATDFATTDWTQIAQLYSLLDQPSGTRAPHSSDSEPFASTGKVAGSPMIRLNHAIAVSYARTIDEGLAMLLALSEEDRRRLRPWWDAAMAWLYERQGQNSRAAAHYRDAIALAPSPPHRQFLTHRLASLSANN